MKKQSYLEIACLVCVCVCVCGGGGGGGGGGRVFIDSFGTDDQGYDTNVL